MQLRSNKTKSVPKQTPPNPAPALKANKNQNDINLLSIIDYLS